MCHFWLVAILIWSRWQQAAFSQTFNQLPPHVPSCSGWKQFLNYLHSLEGVCQSFRPHQAVCSEQSKTNWAKCKCKSGLLRKVEIEAKKDEDWRRKTNKMLSKHKKKLKTDEAAHQWITTSVDVTDYDAFHPQHSRSDRRFIQLQMELKTWKY